MLHALTSPGVNLNVIDYTDPLDMGSVYARSPSPYPFNRSFPFCLARQFHREPIPIAAISRADVLDRRAVVQVGQPLEDEDRLADIDLQQFGFVLVGRFRLERLSGPPET